jgi:thiamine-monophosphate kinase
MDENQLIQWFTDQVPKFGYANLGIGDDAAILSPGSLQVVTSDMLMDGTDFDTAVHGPEDIAYKALAVNLSDIAAMACEPTTAIISLALPRGTTEQWIRRFAKSLVATCRAFRVEIVGGDTNSWSHPLALSITLHGRPWPGIKPTTRAGARPGDWLFVTGALGGSIHGRHLRFRPRVALARWLVEHFEIRAMMDLSDGIATDLPRLCQSSQCGANLDQKLIPIHADVQHYYPANEWLWHALSDGEDFELLFTCSPEIGRRLIVAQPPESELTKVGEIIAQSGVYLVGDNGKPLPLADSGFVHRW